MRYFLFDVGQVLVDFDPADFLEALSAASGRRLEALDDEGFRKIDEVEKGVSASSSTTGPKTLKPPGPKVSRRINFIPENHNAIRKAAGGFFGW